MQILLNYKKTGLNCVTHSIKSEKAVSSLEPMTNCTPHVVEDSKHSKLVEENECVTPSAFEDSLDRVPR